MRTILHIDMDAFFAAIEQHDCPELRGKPVVVGSPPDRRGVVSTCSYEARKFGIHSAMPSRTAYQRCPHAVFLPVRMHRYKEVSRQIMVIFESFTPDVEPVSIDEAFLDVTGAERLFGTGPEIAVKIKAAILQETGLTCSVGIARNKFLAKIASDMQKPDGLTVVPSDPEAIRRFLAPLPIGRMWGIGKVTRTRLEKNGIRTVEDLQNASAGNLTRLLGPAGAESFRRLAFGEDDRPVAIEEREKSISNETTFDKDVSDPEMIRAQLLYLAEKVARRTRAAGYYARTAHLKVRWSDFETVTRQQQMPRAACDDVTFREQALELLAKIPPHRAVRLIGFGVSRLQETPAGEPAQLDLFSDKTDDPERAEKREKLSRAVDRILEKYGRDSIRRASDPDKPG